MKSYEQINARIEAGKAVVLTAHEVMDWVDRKGLEAAAEEIDVVTTATFSSMSSFSENSSDVILVAAMEGKA